jgi:hypothetical protein
MAFLAMAMGEYPSKPSNPKPGMCRMSGGRRTKVLLPPKVWASASLKVYS